MNEPLDPFDWTELGEEPLPGEMDDDELLQAVLAQAGSAPAPVQTAPSENPPRWIQPVVAAVVLLAAAIVLVLYAPSWTDALMGRHGDGSMAPDLEAESEGDDAVRLHGSVRPEPEPAPKPRRQAAPFPEPPIEEPVEAPVEPEPETEPADAAEPEAPRKPKVRRDPPPSADALLREAQDAMASKDNAGAIRKYSTLVRKHPKSAQARAARVSLGRLELAAGRAKKALAHYDAYLDRSGGGMRREAELGRIDALRKLGRKDAEQTAIENFLDAHPSTVHANRLNSRLEALR